MLTTDSAGFIDSANLYQYVFNNPYLYYDPDGRFIQFAIPLFAEFAIGAFITKIVVPAIIGGTVAYFGEKTIRALNASSSSREPFARSLRKQLTWNEFVPLQHALKNTDVYAPDRPLPRDPRTNEPIPETDAPHSELGIKEGTKGKYPQAREFDAQGKPVKDIDFTDHGRPQNHPNPHEHKWKPNPTGGTPIRAPEAEPLTG